MNATRINTDGVFYPVDFGNDQPTFGEGVITGCCAMLALVGFVCFILLVALV